MTEERPPIERLREGTYIKPSASPDKGNCFRLTRVGSWIGVQDDKEYATTPVAERTTLGFTIAELEAFLISAKAGEFDHLIA
ncbi:hypothetical protein GCM10027258_79270 [Amycolatopsis stemonae]